MPQYLSFYLPDDFVASYAKRKVDWGFPSGAGNSLGEITFLTKYSRKKDDGSKETWGECCRRVVEGVYSILKDYCKDRRTPWNEYKAQRAAQDMYERMFTFRWLPPGRGLWAMGTEMVNGQHNSAALQNCAFISTEKLSAHSASEATLPFVRLMEMSMLGIGVGFDTKGTGNLELHEPTKEETTFTIPDSREGWCDSVTLLLESYFFKNRPTVRFDYDLIRPAGEPIKSFGGVAAGPAPLLDLHEIIRVLFDSRSGERITTRDIVDLENLIGKCVVSGNVRRSAEIAIGLADDPDFLDLKNYDLHPERAEFGWTSNNSIFAKVGMDYSPFVDRIADNGEPGLLWLDLCRSHGRLADPPNYDDRLAAGTNPCGEQTLESFECCTLVETFPHRHETLDDFKQTLKHAYLYAKAVTLLPTHWPETNEIMQRNRRIGCSVSGVVQFAESRGWNELEHWLDEGYKAVCERDEKYSRWLGCRTSIKKTSVKPSGTVSLLAGVTPGVHWPVADIYIRRMRLANVDPLLKVLEAAGYGVEPDVVNAKTTSVVSIPVIGPDVRTEADVSMWEKAALAVKVQKWWADNQVSVTVTFDPMLEGGQILSMLRAFEGELKSLSMLPMEFHDYAQMPYERISKKDWEELTSHVKPMAMKSLYSGRTDIGDAQGERFCNNDTCTI